MGAGASLVVGMGTDAGPGTTLARYRMTEAHGRCRVRVCDLGTERRGCIKEPVTGQSGPGTSVAGWQVNGTGLTVHGGGSLGCEAAADDFGKFSSKEVGTHARGSLVGTLARQNCQAHARALLGKFAPTQLGRRLGKITIERGFLPGRVAGNC